MSLVQILTFSLFCLAVASLVPTRWRGGLVLVASLLALFWLQPSTPLRNWDFWLPTLSLILTIWVWLITRVPGNPADRKACQWAILIVIVVVITVAATRYLGPVCCLTRTRPPGLEKVLGLLVGAGLLAYLAARLTQSRRGQGIFVSGTLITLLAVFLLLKNESLAQWLSGNIRQVTGQDATLALPTDLPWLGFSYLAFRLIHVLRDYQSGRLPAVGLGEFLAYALFFPTITAGPIDRLPRFINEVHQEWLVTSAGEAPVKPNWERIYEGGQRILIGVFKKFAVADTLALVALSNQNASQVEGWLWMWVLLYAYSLRIYLDFSGYTDIAIGLARILGIRLPENFNRPYLKQNLAAFWDSWHITLAQWFRAYFFNPVTRSLRSGAGRRWPTWSIILVGQLFTMTLIGAWHGLTWNFVIWGAWHGVGLFIHNRWVNVIRPRLPDLSGRPIINKLGQLASWWLTFNYVSLGWVWFALSSPGLASRVFHKLMGL